MRSFVFGLLALLILSGSAKAQAKKEFTVFQPVSDPVTYSGVWHIGSNGCCDDNMDVQQVQWTIKEASTGYVWDDLWSDIGELNTWGQDFVVPKSWYTGGHRSLTFEYRQWNSLDEQVGTTYTIHADWYPPAGGSGG